MATKAKFMILYDIFNVLDIILNYIYTLLANGRDFTRGCKQKNEEPKNKITS